MQWSDFLFESSDGVGGTSNRILQRRFAANGAPLVDAEIVEETQQTMDPPEFSAISAALGPNGDTLFAWNEEIQEFRGRRVLAPSEPVASPPISLSGRAATETAVAVGAPSSAGAVLWISDECAPGTAPCLYFRSVRSGPGLLSDGFESGDFAAWCGVSGGE